MASSAERGKSSKCWTNTRITGSGSRSATSSSLAPKRRHTFVTADFTAAGLVRLASTAEGMIAPSGRLSTEKPSSEPPCVKRAPATRPGEISTASGGCGIASIQREMCRTRSLWKMPSWYALVLLNEGHLIDLAERGNAGPHFGHAALAQRNHTFFDSRPLDLAGRPPVHDHFPDVVTQVQQFTNRGAPVVPGAGAFQTSRPFRKQETRNAGGIEPRLPQFIRGVLLWLFAILANHAHQALRQNAIESGNEVVRLDAHVDETPDDVRDVVGVHRGEDEVPGQRGLNGDLRRLVVADFAHHDLVRVVAQDGTQAAGKRQALLFVHGNLRDAAQLVFDGVLDGDDLVLVRLDLVDGRIQRGGFAGTRWAGHQHHAVGLVDVTPETPRLIAGKTDDVQAELLEFFRKRFLVEHAEHGVFPVAGGHDGNTQVNVAPLVLHAETAVLGHAALGDVQVAEHLDARDDGGVPFLGDGLHGVLQHAVNAVLHGHFGVTRFNVDVTRAAFQGREDDRFDEPHHWAHRGIARQAVSGNGLFALFFVLGDLQGKGFGSLFQHPLRLLRALQQVADLAGSGDFISQLLAKEQREFIAEDDHARIGDGNHQGVVVRHQGHKVVAEHQVRGNGAEEFRINALFRQVDKATAVTVRQAPRLFALLCRVRCAYRHGGIVRMSVRCGHKRLRSLLSRSRNGERENRQIQGNQNKGYQKPHEYKNNGLNYRHHGAQPEAHFFLIEFRHAVEHGRQRAAGLAHLDHIQCQLRHHSAGRERPVERFAFAHHLRRAPHSTLQQPAGNGLGRRL